MPKRKSVPSLEKLCLENVVKNMERLWLKHCAMDGSLDRDHSHDMKGPFSILAGSLLHELLNIMRKRKLMSPALLHLFFLPQLKELNLRPWSQQIGGTIAHIISVRCK
ncbi:uncharacterized protein LOC121920894 isoform X2 [Sceloporus undulatus]|nr:uncharacterized protein LOC121920894 isoform X2 [Sceloporus undulatus]